MGLSGLLTYFIASSFTRLFSFSPTVHSSYSFNSVTKPHPSPPTFIYKNPLTSQHNLNQSGKFCIRVAERKDVFCKRANLILTARSLTRSCPSSHRRVFKAQIAGFLLSFPICTTKLYLLRYRNSSSITNTTDKRITPYCSAELLSSSSIKPPSLSSPNTTDKLKKDVVTFNNWMGHEKMSPSLLVPARSSTPFIPGL
jgi:hypothetical protein